MSSKNIRASTYTQFSPSSDHDSPKSVDAKKDLWSSMLDGVASGKRLPEKNILVLGGTIDSQREFLEALSLGDSRKTQGRQSNKQPPVANNYALGYTYLDVLDADHEDVLARLSLYLLADPSPSFSPLLKSLLTPQSIPNTLIVVLLDWSQPWFWLRELRNWIRLLRTLLLSLDEDCKERMEEVMISWRNRGRVGSALDGGGASCKSDGDVSLPLGPGEWEEALGLPLCVVCQNSDRMESLERERSWKEDDFDFVLQILRTILLKHGASLIYTIPSVRSPLQGLIHSSLGIYSLLKRQPLKHNVIDRDRVVVPPNWDSWGKIRVLREGFDVEAVNKGWSIDIEEPLESKPDENYCGPSVKETETPPGGSVWIYEETIRDPSLDALQATTVRASNGLIPEVDGQDPQSFLAEQLEELEKIKSEASGMDSSRQAGRQQVAASLEMAEDGQGDDKDRRVNEHIGPVQFNMGGIQVDADDMLQRLKDRQTYQTPEPADPSVVSSQDGKPQTEALANFFASLMKRGSESSATSPKS